MAQKKPINIAELRAAIKASSGALGHVQGKKTCGTLRFHWNGEDYLIVRLPQGDFENNKKVFYMRLDQVLPNKPGGNWACGIGTFLELHQMGKVFPAAIQHYAAQQYESAMAFADEATRHHYGLAPAMWYTERPEGIVTYRYIDNRAHRPHPTDD